MENNNPFEKQLRKMRDDAAFPADNALGFNSQRPDTAEDDYNKIKDVIPQAANDNLEEGFKKMMNLLENNAPTMSGVNAPSMPAESGIGQGRPAEPTVEDVKKTSSRKPRASKKIAAMEKATVEKPVKEEPVTLVETNEDKADKNKTKSEELDLHYTDEEILPLIDSLLSKGYASETTTLRGYNITFRTSYLWEDQETVMRTDAKIADLTLNASGTFFYDTYALAANLEQFGANYFKPVSKGTPAELKESFDERVEFLEGLSSPFINILMRKKLEFLKKVQFLLDNYDRLLQAF